MRKTTAYARSRRHHVVHDAGLRLLHLARPYDDGEMVSEHIKTRTSYEALKNGTGTEFDFDRVSMTLNVGAIRAESIDALLTQTMTMGLDAFARMKDRYLRGLAFGFDAAGLRDVPAALDAFEAVMDASSPLQMKMAIEEAWRRLTGTVL